MENLPDEALIALSIKNNQAATKLLVERYLPLVYSVSRRYLRHSEDAEDATQETFVKIWRNLKKINPDKPLKPWIGEITKNTCLDIIKKRRDTPFSAFETADGFNPLTENAVSSGPLPSDLAELSMTKKLLARAIQKAPPRFAQILSLYYNDELNFREIGEKLNESINTIKSRHRRALLFLRKLLQEP